MSDQDMNKKRSPDDKNGEKVKSNLTRFAFYSGLGFQMIAIIGVFTYIGFQIDAHLMSEKPIYTAILSLLGVCISLYSVIRSVNKK